MGRVVVFTFGREHEQECARRNVRNPAQSGLVTELIDAVHDLLEAKASDERVRSAVRAAFVEGGSGVWDQAGSWLRKLCQEYPGFSAMERVICSWRGQAGAGRCRNMERVISRPTATGTARARTIFRINHAAASISHQPPCAAGFGRRTRMLAWLACSFRPRPTSRGKGCRSGRRRCRIRVGVQRRQVTFETAGLGVRDGW